MFGIISDLLTLTVGVLVIFAAIYALRLSRRLTWLRQDRAELEMLFRQFNESVRRADVVLAQLKEATGGGASHLKESIAHYQSLVSQMDQHAKHAEEMMGKLENDLGTKVRGQTKRRIKHSSQANYAGQQSFKKTEDAIAFKGTSDFERRTNDVLPTAFPKRTVNNRDAFKSALNNIR